MRIILFHNLKYLLLLRTLYGTITMNSIMVIKMSFVTVSDARKNLYKLVDRVAKNHEPTLIKGKRNAAVLISSEDWDDLQETLYVAQNKKLSDSLLKGMKESYDACSDKLEW
jgi:antitoxin YefM